MPANSEAPNQHDRRRVIQSRLRENGTVRISELAKELDVSEMTIRRDLDELDALGLARRIRGGAAAIGPEPFEERHQHNARAKAKIAEKLADLLPPTGTIAFDASSTVHRLATSINAARDLVVVTNGLDTFQALGRIPGVTTILTGGTREPRTGSLVGPLATCTAEEFLFDLFICSAAAVDPDIGSSEASLAEAEVKRSFAKTSARIVLAVDHTKLGGRAQTRMFRPEDIDTLVTDLTPDNERLADYAPTVKII